MNYPTVCVNVKARIYFVSNELVSEPDCYLTSIVIEGDLEYVNKVLHDTARLAFYDRSEIIDTKSAIHYL